MNDYRKYFLKAIRNTYPDNHPGIILQVDSHYNDISPDTKFALTSKNPIDKRLDFCSYFLALIKTLDKQGETFESIRKICLEIVTEYVQPKNKMHGSLKRLFLN